MRDGEPSAIASGIEVPLKLIRVGLPVSESVSGHVSLSGFDLNVAHDEMKGDNLVVRSRSKSGCCPAPKMARKLAYSRIRMAASFSSRI